MGIVCNPCCVDTDPFYDTVRLKGQLCAAIDRKIQQIDDTGSVLLQLCREYRTNADYDEQEKLIEEVEDKIQNVR